MNLQYVIPPFLENESQVVSDIWNSDVHLEKGKHYLLRASSGKGKSTILGYLIGSRKRFQGNILFNGNSVAPLNNDQWSNLRQNVIACMFQELRLFDNLTVRENLQLKLDLQTKYTMNDAESWLRELGLDGIMDRNAETLSLGQQQRVALVRTLLQPMEWLLLDEPFSHLDRKNAALCLGLIMRICKGQQTGIIMTTLGDAYEFAYDYLLEL